MRHRSSEEIQHQRKIERDIVVKQLAKEFVLASLSSGMSPNEEYTDILLDQAIMWANKFIERFENE